MGETTIRWTGGVKKLEPIQYWIEAQPAACRWWRRRREEFYICCEFSSLGPFETRSDALKMIALTGAQLKD